MVLERSKRIRILNKLAEKSLSNAPTGVVKPETMRKRVAQAGHVRSFNSEQLKRLLRRKLPSKNEYATPGTV